MRCKNKFCIYYRKERCTAEDVAINSVGMCEDCVYVEIDESELKIKRVDALEKMDRQYQRQAGLIPRLPARWKGPKLPCGNRHGRPRGWTGSSRTGRAG